MRCKGIFFTQCPGRILLEDVGKMGFGGEGVGVLEDGEWIGRGGGWIIVGV